MNLWYTLLLMIALIPMVVSDFKTRKISLIFLIVFAALSVFVSVEQSGLNEMWINSIYNILLLIYMSVGVILYLWIKNRRLTNPLNAHLGLGDVLFILSLVPLFTLRAYLWFLIIGMSLSLVWGLIKGRYSKQPVSIPLVGTIGVLLCFYWTWNLLMR